MMRRIRVRLRKSIYLSTYLPLAVLVTKARPAAASGGVRHPGVLPGFEEPLAAGQPAEHHSGPAASTPPVMLLPRCNPGFSGITDLPAQPAGGHVSTCISHSLMGSSAPQ